MAKGVYAWTVAGSQAALDGEEREEREERRAEKVG
jgi:hypothetical protein